MTVCRPGKERDGCLNSTVHGLGATAENSAIQKERGNFLIPLYHQEMLSGRDTTSLIPIL